jgi:transcriptional regulator with XRE-family HTH domain
LAERSDDAPVEPKEQFGMNLRRLRDAAGLTQLDLALECGMEMAEISRYELGQRDPRLSTIARLAAGLGLDPADLVSGVRPSPRRRRRRPRRSS